MFSIKPVSIGWFFGKFIILKNPVFHIQFIQFYLPPAVIPFKCSKYRNFLYNLLQVFLWWSVAIIIFLRKKWIFKVNFLYMNFLIFYIYQLHQHIHFTNVGNHILTNPSINFIKFYVIKMYFFKINHYFLSFCFFLFRRSKIIYQKLVIPNRISPFHIYYCIIQPYIFQRNFIFKKKPVIYISLYGTGIQ